MYDFIDVNSMDELPRPPEGFRFLDFIGGTKELRCYMLPEELPRGQFFKNHPSLLEDWLLPIYENNGICVRQDASYPIPGFFIVAAVDHYRSLDEVDELTNARLFFILQKIRKGMRDVLGLEYIHLYYQEKVHAGCDVHFWLLPIYNIQPDLRIINFQLLPYLKSFVFSQQKKLLIQCREKMKSYVGDSGLLARDNDFAASMVSDRIFPGASK
jgi:diadenosine tetraphosphate (Ap4A) HIT family hydrolase